jgi:hypothetical protein
MGLLIMNKTICLAVTFAFVALLSFPHAAQTAVAERVDSDGVSGKSVSLLIEQLSAPKFAAREQASSELIALGMSAVPALLDACESTDPERAYRAIEAVEMIALSGSVEDLKLVMIGLLRKAKEGNPHLLSRCKKMISRYSEFRSELAVKKLRSMGATVGVYSTNHADRFAADLIFIAPRMIVAEVEEEIIPIQAREIEFTEVPDDIEVPADAVPQVQQDQADDSAECGSVPDDLASDEPVDEIPGLNEQPANDTPANDTPANDTPANKDAQTKANVDAAQAAIDEELEQLMKALSIDELAPPAGKMKDPTAVDARAIAFEGGPIAVDGRVMIMGGGFALDGAVNSNNTSDIHTINIDKNWTGGTEGLRYLAEVNNLQSLQISELNLNAEHFAELAKLNNVSSLTINQCRFSAKDMFAFRQSAPHLNVSAIGSAMMGVYPVGYGPAAIDQQALEQLKNESEDAEAVEKSPLPESGCLLQRVAENSGAFDAGLRAGDMIIEVDGFKVVDFPTLTYTVAGREVGDVLHARILDQTGKLRDIEIKLGSRTQIEP